MKKAIDVKVNVKPVFSNMIHTGIWEGPCRVGTKEELDPVYEKRTGKEQFVYWKTELEKNIDSRYANILEPVYIEFDEKFVVPASELEKLEPDVKQTDFYLISYRVPGIEVMGKPVTMINKGPTPLDVIPFFRDLGMNAWFANDYDEYNEKLRFLQVQKAVANTKWLVLSATEQITATGYANPTDFLDLYKRYGIRHNRRSFRDIFDKYETMQVTDKMKKTATDIISSAKESKIKDEFVLADVKFHDAVIEMMEDYDCNGFTITCKELCASRLPYKNKITPCLCHSINNANGIPSACEEDIGALLTMTFLTYLTKKAIYMGNSVLVVKGTKEVPQIGMPKLLFTPEMTFDEDVLEIHHAVPTWKMAGLDKPDLPYDLGHFTQEGFGTKVQVNLYDAAPEKTVTLARFNRHGDCMLVARGEILGSEFKEVYCSPESYFRIEGGARGLRIRQAEGLYGNHLCLVYGDHVEEIKKLGAISGFSVEHFS
jgi:hypothetical protein